VAEYVLYHEILHLESGLDSLTSGHDRDFRIKEKMYVKWKEADEWLNKVASRRVLGT
jgi:hypothetical protein